MSVGDSLITEDVCSAAVVEVVAAEGAIGGATGGQQDAGAMSLTPARHGRTQRACARHFQKSAGQHALPYQPLH